MKKNLKKPKRLKNSEYPKCPKCGSEIIVGNGKKNGIKYKCENGHVFKKDKDYTLPTKAEEKFAIALFNLITEKYENLYNPVNSGLNYKNMWTLSEDDESKFSKISIKLNDINSAKLRSSLPRLNVYMDETKKEIIIAKGRIKI